MHIGLQRGFERIDLLPPKEFKALGEFREKSTIRLNSVYCFEAFSRNHELLILSKLKVLIFMFLNWVEGACNLLGMFLKVINVFIKVITVFLKVSVKFGIDCCLRE